MFDWLVKFFSGKKEEAKPVEKSEPPVLTEEVREYKWETAPVAELPEATPVVEPVKAASAEHKDWPFPKEPAEAAAPAAHEAAVKPKKARAAKPAAPKAAKPKAAPKAKKPKQ